MLFLTFCVPTIGQLLDAGLEGQSQAHKLGPAAFVFGRAAHQECDLPLAKGLVSFQKSYFLQVLCVHLRRVCFLGARTGVVQ